MINQYQLVYNIGWLSNNPKSKEKEIEL